MGLTKARRVVDRLSHHSNAMVTDRRVTLRDRRHEIIDEATTLQRWRTAGIACVEVVEHNDHRMVTRLQPGIDPAIAWQNGDPRVWPAVVRTYHRIRQLAIATGDKSLLHADPLPRNFLWSGGEAVALDPGQGGRMRPPIERLDAVLTLLMLHAFGSVWPAMSAGDAALLTEPYDREGIDRMIQINARVSPWSSGYQTASRRLLAWRSGSTRRYVRFAREDLQRVDGWLRRQR